jgi:ubiquinone/menaquinone biosynthesis C-methylase UbiE
MGEIHAMSERGNIYPASHAYFLDSPIRRLLQPPAGLIEKLHVRPTDTAVDFGCGPGFYTLELAKTAKEVVAVDLQVGMLQRVKHKAERAEVRNIRFLQTDGKTLKLLDASVDKILLVTVYHEVTEPEAVLKEFSRVLKPDGKLIVVEVVKQGILPGAPVQNPETLKAEIEASDFKLEQMQPYKSYGVFFFTKNA